MAFSFDVSLSRLLDHVRLGLGDVDASGPLLDDETILAKVGLFGYVEGLAQLADALAVRVAQEPTAFGEGSAGLSVKWDERIAAWRQLARDCRAGLVASPVGGVGVAVLDQLRVPGGLICD